MRAVTVVRVKRVKSLITLITLIRCCEDDEDETYVDAITKGAGRAATMSSLYIICVLRFASKISRVSAHA